MKAEAAIGLAGRDGRKSRLLLVRPVQGGKQKQIAHIGIGLFYEG
jgi:hypothetical protein